MISLYQHLSARQADMCALVLAASNIDCRIERHHTGFQVQVKSEEFTRALSVMALYFQENPELEAIEAAPVQISASLYSGIVAAMFLAVFHLAAGEDRKALIKTFGSSASDILSGELYRTVTSLTLHVDAVHLVGNMAAIALFGSAVCAIRGVGVGWLMILLTGVLGNFGNAMLYRTSHLAVGASTAVFGAIGILSAHQFRHKRELPEKRIKAWLPLAGGLALLAILGTGAGHVDVMAHLFGFLSGILMESMIYRPIQRIPVKKTRTIQLWCLTAVGGIVALAWLWPEL